MFIVSFLAKLCNNNTYDLYIVYFMYMEKKIQVEKLGLVILSLFRQYNMIK